MKTSTRWNIFAVMLGACSAMASDTSPIVALSQKVQAEGALVFQLSERPYYYIIDSDQKVLRIRRYEKKEGSERLVAVFWDTGPSGPNGSVDFGNGVDEKKLYYNMNGEQVGGQFARDWQRDYSTALREIYMHLQSQDTAL